MNISGYDPRPEPEEKEHWEHFCEGEKKELIINKGECCKFCSQPEKDEKGFYSWLGKYGI